MSTHPLPHPYLQEAAQLGAILPCVLLLQSSFKAPCILRNGHLPSCLLHIIATVELEMKLPEFEPTLTRLTRRVPQLLEQPRIAS